MSGALDVRSRRVVTWVAIALVLAAVACNLPGQGLFAPPGPTATPTVDVASLPPTAPQVVAQRPYPGEELPLDGSIDIYFDQPMDQASVEAAFSTAPALQSSLTWINESTLRVTPASGQLARARRYTLTIGQAAKAENGLAFEAPHAVEVQTVGFLEVGEVVPAPDAGMVETDAVITVLFNRPVVPLTIAEDMPDLPQPLTFSPDVPGEGEWLNTSIYLWKPSDPLAGGTTYTVTVEAGLEDQTGGVLEEDYAWQFTTLPPDVITAGPTDTGVALNEPVVVEFNQPMDRATVQRAFSLTGPDGQAVPGSFTWDGAGRTLTFRPAVLLPLGQTFTATILGSARGASGTADLGQDVTWTFETAPPPAIVSTNPAAGAENALVYGGITFFFSAPLNEETLSLDLLDVNPALPEEVTTYYNSYDNSWNVNAVLEPSTRYTVTLRPGAADPYGYVINQPFTFSFTTEPLSPLVQFNTRGQFGLYDASRTTELFVITRNVSRVDMELASLSLEDFGRLTSFGSYELLDNFTPEPEQVVRTWTIPSTGGLNEGVYVRVPVVSEEGGSLEPGIYLLTATAPEIEGRFRHFMLVVTANLTLKSGFDESLVWLTDLQSGRPVTGVRVALYDEFFTRFADGSTGPDGVAEIAHGNIDNLWDSRYAIAQSGGVFAVGLSQWDEGVSPWEFGSIPTQFNIENYSLYIYTDRPIYRPGQEVFFKGILRAKDDVTYTLPPETEVLVSVYSDQGDVISQETLPVDEFGTLNGSILLDEEATLGYYSIEVTAGPMTYGRGFQVAEYRKPDFQVNVEPQAAQVLTGDQIVVAVEAEFFFGGPVSNAQVEWTALADRYLFQYQGPGNYSFSDDSQDQRYGPDFVPGFGEEIANGQGTTDAEGRFVIRLPANLVAADTSRRFTIEATVTDINAVSVSGRAQVVVHKGQLYAGVSPDVYVATAGERVSASLIAVDWEGQPAARQGMEVELIEQEWSSVREEDEFGRTQWTWIVEETRIGQPVTVTTDGQGRASANFTPPRAGSYKIRATVSDPLGNAQSGSAFVWVSGSEFVAWRQANNDRIDLVADKDTYAPGETAEILIASPFQGRDVRALVTIERGSILSHEVITLDSNSHVYRLPITGDLAPNIFVSVVIVKGVDSTNPIPAFRMGLLRLGVEPVEQTIRLEVTPSEPTIGPGEEVAYSIRATDHRGRPVDAEVSLALVDLATLSLAPPNSGPIVDHFYGNAPLGIRTSVPLIYLVDRLNQELFDRGKGGGGGGAEGFFDIRTDFRDTAYWEATVRTGSNGRAEVKITLPDNLTTWRMDARAVTLDTLVGQAQVDVVATRPLLVRPNTPRFFVAGDESTLSAVVNNNTERAINATVSLEAVGASLRGQAEQRVNVPAGGRVEVSWPVTVEADVEWVDLTFSARGGGLSDASKPPLGDPANGQMLPVLRFDVPETVGTAGQLAEAGVRTEGIVLPPTYTVEQGHVEVRIDPSLAAATIDGLTWLEHFPYECTEQTVSRFLPNALTLRALRQFNIRDAELERNLAEQLNVGLQRLYAQQHLDGGWGWFVTSESSPTVTAYVVQGLVAAQEAGFAVEQRVLDEAIGYLKGELAPLSSLSEQHALHSQATILYVLALADQPDVSRTVQLYDARQGMQHWAQALLAQTLWRIDPADSRLANLKSDLTTAAILNATGAHWEEDAPDRWNWNTDTRSTAIILDTFALLWPDSELAPNAVRWLMAARRAGHWETTQETAWALIALSDWMAASGELEADYRWALTFNGQPTADGVADESTLRQTTEIDIDISQLLRDEVNRLTITREAGPGRLYYATHLVAYLPVEEVLPLSRGIIVNRRYLDEQGSPVTQGRVGDTLTVELTIIAPNDLYYVVVEDPYPAGAEAVDTGLLTESVLGERPILRPDDPLAQGWGWWWFSETDLRDEKAVLFADYLPAGTYQHTYQIRLGLPGAYRVIPPVAQEFYMPEVYGRGAGTLFTIVRP